MSTSITKKVTINGEGKNIILDGLDFTADGCLEVRQAASLVVRNCRVFGLNAPNSRNYWLKIIGDIPVCVQIEHCYFGKNPAKLYNLFEMAATLQDGSHMDDNYFAAGCCAHSVMGIYGAEEEATIHIDRNVFEESAGAIQISVKHAPRCSFEICANKVEANKTGESEMWYGLCCIQPCGTDTETFANMTILFDGNELPCEQIAYGYSDSKDTRLENENMPAVTVNGEAAVLPIYH